MGEVKYIVTEHKGYFSSNDAYNMRDVQAIISGLVRDAKEEGRKTLKLTIEIQ